MVDRKYAAGYGTGFDAVWEAWPRKIKKGACRRAWNEKPMLAPPFVELTKIALQHAAWYRQAGVPPRYVPTIESWINDERWEDELGDPTGLSTDPMALAAEMGWAPDPRYDAQGRYVGLRKEEN